MKLISVAVAAHFHDISLKEEKYKGRKETEKWFINHIFDRSTRKILWKNILKPITFEQFQTKYILQTYLRELSSDFNFKWSISCKDYKLKLATQETKNFLGEAYVGKKVSIIFHVLFYLKKMLPILRIRLLLKRPSNSSWYCPLLTENH